MYKNVCYKIQDIGSTKFFFCFLKYAMEELYFNNNKKARHKTNFSGVEILHPTNLQMKSQKKFLKD